MRFVAALFLSLIAGTASARQDDPRLDRLFGELQVVDDGQALALQSVIWQVWVESGSDTIDLLMQRGTAAMQADSYDAALTIFNAIVEIDPDFAEGWNKRATLHFLMGNYPQSVLDIQRTLDLEPRHFGALSGLGMIMERIGRKPEALDAYRRALEVNPHLLGARESIKTLERDVEGRGI